MRGPDAKLYWPLLFVEEVGPVLLDVSDVPCQRWKEEARWKLIVE